MQASCVKILIQIAMTKTGFLVIQAITTNVYEEILTNKKFHIINYSNFLSEVIYIKRSENSCPQNKFFLNWQKFLVNIFFVEGRCYQMDTFLSLFGSRSRSTEAILRKTRLRHLKWNRQHFFRQERAVVFTKNGNSLPCRF